VGGERGGGEDRRGGGKGRKWRGDGSKYGILLILKRGMGSGRKMRRGRVGKVKREEKERGELDMEEGMKGVEERGRGNITIMKKSCLCFSVFK
jgi:hypothetical protein